MDGQTFLILDALGHPDRAAVVIALLGKDGREKDLVNELGLSQKTANRHFSMLRHVGLVRRDSPHGPYRLTAHAETRVALEAMNALATTVLGARAREDEALGSRIRRSRFKGPQSVEDETSAN